MRVFFGVVVTGHQSVVGVDLIIDSGTERRAAAGNGNGFIETNDVVIRIEYGCYDERFVVGVALVEIDKERGFSFQDWSTKVATVLPRLDRRPARLANGLREFKASSLKLNETCPRYRRCLGE